MKAIILPTGKPDNLKPLTDWMPEYLLPVANKPIVEHLIELLVRNNIKDIIMVLRHMPYETEKYFGNGERWGVNIHYSLERNYRGVADSLKRIESLIDGPFLCLPANIVTNLNISEFTKEHEDHNSDLTILEQSKGNDTNVQASSKQGDGVEVFSPFIMTPKALSHILYSSHNGFATKTYYSSCNSRVVLSLHDYWNVNQQVLNNEFNRMIIPGRQNQDGIWFGRHNNIHPNANLKPSILTGTNCNIKRNVTINGPTAIGDNVIVGQNAFIERSIILSNTYVGPNTDIKDSIVSKNYIINIPRKVTTYISEDFILGDIEKKMISAKGTRIFNLIAALLLFTLSLPIFIVLYSYHLAFPSRKLFSSEKRFGSYEIVNLCGDAKPKSFNLYSFKCNNVLLKKIPGLLNVIKGDMNLVGSTPLTGMQVRGEVRERGYY